MQFIARCKIVLAVFLILSGNAFAACDGNTITMLHGNGTDASTTITDSELIPKTYTANGNAQLDTAQSKFGTAFLFDGTGDTVSTADFSWNAGTASWTIDFWVRFNTLDEAVFWNQRASGSSSNYLRWRGTGLNRVDYFSGQASTEINVNFPFTPSTNTWYHIEFGRDGTNGYYAFVDGVSKTVTYATGTASTSITDVNATIYIGGREAGVGDLYLNGWLDEFRVSNIIRHTSGFIPPTSEYCASSTPTACFLGDLI